MGEQLEALKFAIKSELLGQFKSAKAKEGDLLSRKWLYDDFLPSLSGKEEKALEEIIREMTNEGIIEYAGGSQPTYRITQKGVAILC